MAGQGSKPGERRGGRKAGTPNKLTNGLKERLASWDCDPFQVLANIARGELQCGVCRGEGRTKFQPGGQAKGSRAPGVRICQSCWGSGLERISPAERGKAAAELCQYVEAKRKAIEHTGAEGGPIEHKHEIVLVE